METQDTMEDTMEDTTHTHEEVIKEEVNKEIGDREIDEALLSHHYMGEGSISRSGLLSHRSDDSRESFLTWFRPSDYGLPLTVEAYCEAGDVCGYAFSLSEVASRVASLGSSWERDFVAHCREVGRYRYIKMSNKKGKVVTLAQARRVLKKHGAFELLVSCGVCYTGSSLRGVFGCSAMGLFRVFPNYEDVILRVWEEDIDEILHLASSESFRTAGEFCDYLRGVGFVSRTGCPISKGVLSGIFSERGVSIMDFRDSSIEREISVSVLAWHNTVHAQYRHSVDVRGLRSSGGVVKDWNERGFLSKGGKSWGRWSLCLIVRRHPDWDWSFPDVDEWTPILDKVREHWQEGAYKTLAEFQEVVGIPYVPLSAAMKDLGYEISYYGSDEYNQWLDGVVRTMSEVILYSGTGYARLAKFFNERGVVSRAGGVWHASTIQRLCELHEIDRDDLYRDAFIRGYSDWVLEVSESDMAGYLNDLGIYPPNVRGRYAKWDWDKLSSYLEG